MGKKSSQNSTDKKLLKLLAPLTLLILLSSIFVLDTQEQRSQNQSFNTTKPVERVQQSSSSSTKVEYLSFIEPQINTTEEVSTKGDKPLLAIIIDDVSSRREVDALNSLGITLSKSYLPPKSSNRASETLAKNDSFYMIHIPLEAALYAHQEPLTLLVGDSVETIEHRVKELARIFPEARYANNHTGSTFTSDVDSMRALIEALDRYNITFVDSRTTSKTVVPSLMKELHRRYIGRDIFLDHEENIETIKKQLKKAIAIAHKRGYAIAIGHPRKLTIKALRESKELLNSVELVYLDELVVQRF